MASELIDPANLKLVEFLKSNLDDSKRPVRTSNATRIIRCIFKERGGKLCGMTKADFLARAEELHEQRSASDIDHVCSTCFKVFRNWLDKDRHEKGIHRNDTNVQFKCSLCEKSYMGKTSLNYHIDVAHSVKPVLKCQMCKKVHGLYKIDFDKAEEKFRQDDGSLKCSSCGQQFEGDDAIEDMKTHVVNKCKSTVGVVQCEECGKPFGGLASLKMHIKTKHRNDYSVHSCKHCNFSSAYRSNLKKHLKRCQRWHLLN